jgi:arginine deiminase
MIMETIYRFSPMFAAEKFPIWLGGVSEDWGRSMSRAATCSPSATAR